MSHTADQLRDRLDEVCRTNAAIADAYQEKKRRLEYALQTLKTTVDDFENDRPIDIGLIRETIIKISKRP